MGSSTPRPPSNDLRAFGLMLLAALAILGIGFAYAVGAGEILPLARPALKNGLTASAFFLSLFAGAVFSASMKDRIYRWPSGRAFFAISCIAILPLIGAAVFKTSYAIAAAFTIGAVVVLFQALAFLGELGELLAWLAAPFVWLLRTVGLLPKQAEEDETPPKSASIPSNLPSP